VNGEQGRAIPELGSQRRLILLFHFSEKIFYSRDVVQLFSVVEWKFVFLQIALQIDIQIIKIWSTLDLYYLETTRYNGQGLAQGIRFPLTVWRSKRHLGRLSNSQDDFRIPRKTLVGFPRQSSSTAAAISIVGSMMPATIKAKTVYHY
jgi:hypothetical protein